MGRLTLLGLVPAGLLLTGSLNAHWTPGLTVDDVASPHGSLNDSAFVSPAAAPEDAASSAVTNALTLREESVELVAATVFGGDPFRGKIGYSLRMPADTETPQRWQSSIGSATESLQRVPEPAIEPDGSSLDTKAVVSFFDRVGSRLEIRGDFSDGFAEEFRCLALNVYWEARSEPMISKIAIAQVTLNRVADAAFPDSICDVVRQGGAEDRHRCQFSWFCDGKKDEPSERLAWQEAQDVAYLALLQWVPDPTGGAMWYHADYVKPTWSRALLPMTRIGRHIYYVGNDGSEDRQKGASLQLAQDIVEDVDDLIQVRRFGDQRRSDDAGVSSPLDDQTRVQ
jgi:hypothetical protein